MSYIYIIIELNIKIKEVIFMKEYVELSSEEVLFLKNLLSKQLKEYELNEKDLEKIGGGSVLPKKFAAGLLTAISMLSYLPNQSVEAMNNTNYYSSVIRKSDNDDLTDKKFSLETLKKLKIPIAVAGVIGGTILIGTLTLLTIHQLVHAKTPEQVNRIVGQAVENEGGKNITPDKFIATVNATREAVEEKLKKINIDENTINRLVVPFKNLENEARKSTEMNEFNEIEFSKKFLTIIDTVMAEVKSHIQKIKEEELEKQQEIKRQAEETLKREKERKQRENEAKQIEHKKLVEQVRTAARCLLNLQNARLRFFKIKNDVLKSQGIELSEDDTNICKIYEGTYQHYAIFTSNDPIEQTTNLIYSNILELCGLDDEITQENIDKFKAFCESDEDIDVKNFEGDKEKKLLEIFINKTKGLTDKYNNDCETIRSLNNKNQIQTYIKNLDLDLKKRKSREPNPIGEFNLLIKNYFEISSNKDLYPTYEEMTNDYHIPSQNAIDLLLSMEKNMQITLKAIDDYNNSPSPESLKKVLELDYANINSFSMITILEQFESKKERGIFSSTLDKLAYNEINKYLHDKYESFHHINKFVLKSYIDIFKKCVCDLESIKDTTVLTKYIVPKYLDITKKYNTYLKIF